MRGCLPGWGVEATEPGMFHAGSRPSHVCGLGVDRSRAAGCAQAPGLHGQRAGRVGLGCLLEISALLAVSGAGHAGESLAGGGGHTVLLDGVVWEHDKALQLFQIRLGV